MGTRFLATPEANAHTVYKEKLVAVSEEGTVCTILFGNGWPNAAHRVLRRGLVEPWLPHEAQTQASYADALPIGETVIGRMMMPLLFAALASNAAAKGDVESMGLYAGQSVGLVNDIRPAEEIVRGMMAEAKRIIEKLRSS